MSFGSSAPKAITPPPAAPLKEVSVEKNENTNQTGTKTLKTDLKKLQIPLIQGGNTSGLNVPKE